jgi:hypothetical protein
MTIWVNCRRVTSVDFIRLLSTSMKTLTSFSSFPCVDCDAECYLFWDAYIMILCCIKIELTSGCQQHSHHDKSLFDTTRVPSKLAQAAVLVS